MRFLGLPSPTHRRPRTLQRRNPLPPKRRPSRSYSPSHVDDMEMRSSRHSLRRSQRRSLLQPKRNVPNRTRTLNKTLHKHAPRLHRTPQRRASPRRLHKPSNHGMDNGHLQPLQRLQRPRMRHRKTNNPRRLRRKNRSNLTRSHNLHTRSHQTPRHENEGRNGGSTRIWYSGMERRKNSPRLGRQNRRCQRLPRRNPHLPRLKSLRDI